MVSDNLNLSDNSILTLIVYPNYAHNWKCFHLSLQVRHNSWSWCIETELKCRSEMFLLEILSKMQPIFQRNAICLARSNSLIGSCNVEGGPCTAAKAFSWHWNASLKKFFLLEIFSKMQPSFQRNAICLARSNSLIGSCNVEGGACTAAKAISWHWNASLKSFCSKSSVKCS